MNFKLPKVWLGIDEVCERWNCLHTDILHLAQTEKLALHIDWRKIEQPDPFFGSPDCHFVLRPSFSQSYPSASFINDIKFIEEGKSDSSGRMKYHPVSTNVLTRLAYVIPSAVERLIQNNVYEFDCALVRNAELSEGNSDWYTANTGLYIDDYELICEYREDVAWKGISTAQLLVLSSEVERLEQEHENGQDSEHTNQSPQNELLGLDEDEIPDLLYYALSLYKEAWRGLPTNMRTPKKSELETVLKEKGLTKPAHIDAVIKVSIPNGITLGGKQSPELTDWKPLHKRSI